MRALLIYNPNAKSGKSVCLIPEIIEFFKKNHIYLNTYETTAPGDATEKAGKSKYEYDTIIAGGGDGTINEVINGIMSADTNHTDSTNKNKKPARLGIIPLGTENVLAQELKIPLDCLKACQKIISGKTIKADLGLVKTKEKQRYFILMAGIGFDAHIAKKVEPKLKELLGSAAYVLTGMKEILGYTPNKMTVKINGNSFEGYYVIVGNIKLYGGYMMLTHRASINDGFLDVCMLQSKDLLNFFKFLFGIVIKQHEIFDDVKYIKVKKVVIESEKPVLVHVDAEIIGTTPVEIEVCPQILEIIC